MLRKICLAAVAVAAVAPVVPSAFAGSSTGPVTPALVGDWKFAGAGTDASAVTDSTRNWSTFTAHGATLDADGLAVAGSGNGEWAATQWAAASGYTGPKLTDKTLVAWVRIDNPLVTSGSPLSLYDPDSGAGSNAFDAIDYGEQGGNRWMAGSDFFWRTAPFPYATADTDTTQVRQIAISYQGNGDGSETISGCLNGTSLGSYSTAGRPDAVQSFGADSLALFGPRHMFSASSPVGSIDAHIAESRIYAGAMTCDQVNALNDTTPPSFLSLVTDQTYEATSAAGAVGSWSVPSATDDVDRNPVVTCDHQPGDTYPIGATPVICTATDAEGNTATDAFTVNVTYGFGGVKQPINPNGSSVFKAGSTVPVKFTLSGASAGITDAVATLRVTYMTSAVDGTVIEADSTAAATAGNTFRYDPTSGQYIYNWSTKGLAVGSYKLGVNLGDGVDNSVTVSLR